MSALVSARGRLFYIMDEGSRISIQLPPKWALIGRDAFNGTELWKREIPEWSPHLWPLKSGPTQLARRLVAAWRRGRVRIDIAVRADPGGPRRIADILLCGLRMPAVKPGFR